ncbi:MAG: ABC transporter permease [Oscillochloris sp.]|nr:ABC transporter permease [Oscillochloris sp.]
MAVVPAPTTPVAKQIAPAHRSEWSQVWRRFTANRLALVGLAIVAILCLFAIFAEAIAPHDPIQSFPGKRGDPAEAGHILGFDHIGRDLFSRIVFGSRVALIVGLLGTGIAVLIGVIVGAAAAYFGGTVDLLLSRLIDVLMAFPLLALLLVLSAVIGPSLSTTIIVIGTTAWARFARVVRADVLSLKERDFVLAARAIGASDTRIVLRHILPNVLGPVIVLASLGVGSIIILESALSFLGLGIQPPTPSWGRILSDGRAFITNYPHISIAPGIMIVITVLAFNFIGDGLRDAFDPHHRG